MRAASSDPVVNARGHLRAAYLNLIAAKGFLPVGKFSDKVSKRSDQVLRLYEDLGGEAS